jgi:hypothetical protein
MLIQAANIIGGAVLAEPLARKVSWLSEPMQKFGAATAPYRTAIGVTQMGIAGAGLLCNTGIIDIPLLYSASALDIGAGLLAGGLLTENLWRRLNFISPFCDPLHRYETYIGAGTVAVGALGLLGY